MKNTYLPFVLALVFFVFACQDKNMPMPPGNECGEEKDYRQGVFIVNEGNLSSGVGTISFYRSTDQEVENSVFQAQNCDAELGSVAQSIFLHQGLLYIVVHNSDIIHVVRAEDFRTVGTITGLELPRFFLAIDDQKAYVSQWGEGLRDKANIAVVDLVERKVLKTIPTGAGTENLLRQGDKVYAVNEGALLNDSLLLVLDPQRDEIVQRIALPFYNPHSLQTDQNGDLWVLCRGFTDWDNGRTEAGALLKLQDDQVVKSFTVPNFSRRLKISPDGSTLYFVLEQGGIARHPIDAPQLDPTPIANGQFYNLGIDPSSGELYATDYLDFSSSGKVFIYDADGNPLSDFSVGIGPSELLFVD